MNLHPAPIGKRAGALLIDLICYAVVVWLFGHLMMALGDKYGELSIMLVMFALYPVTVLICWLVGNTPGKKLTRLYIVDAISGETPSALQYIRRSILFIFLFSLNIVLVIPVLVSKKNKAFHDMIAGTMVIEE
jgi:uncharacterized RDD family membrane protein YckC